MVHAYWHILEDYPSEDGDYVVCFLTDEGDYGWPEIWRFERKEGWQPVFGQDYQDQPTHWCRLPMPK
jgi:hypothetical protein